MTEAANETVEKLLLECHRAQAWYRLEDEKEYARCHASMNDLLDLLDLDQADAAARITTTTS